MLVPGDAHQASGLPVEVHPEDLSTARGTEMLLPVWVRLYGALGSPDFNFHVVK